MENEITLTMMRERLYSAVVCDALDSLGLRSQSPTVALAPRTVERTLIGRCRTTLWEDLHHNDPDPYALELQAVDACQPDDVLIAAAGGSLRSGIWGELLTTAAMNGGCVGAIVDGAIRDSPQMTKLGFPVFARGTCIYDSLHRQRVIELDVPVEIGDVRFTPGDLVIADRDGIVVVPQKVEQETIARAWQKIHAENTTRDAIRQGLKATEAYRKYGVL